MHLPVSSPLPTPRATLQWRRTAYAICYCLVAVGLAYRIAYIVEYNPIHQIWSDPQRHLEQGIDTLRNDPMSMTDPILYQLYIGAIMKLTLKIPALVAFYTCLLAIVGPWIWYCFFRELQSDKLSALAGWAVLSIMPAWIGIYGYFMQETLLIPVLGLALHSTWRCRRKATLSTFALMVLLWAFAGLTRGICIPMAAVATLWIWFAQGGKLPRVIAALAVLGLILGPLTYRSLSAVNIFAPHGIGHLNMIYTKSGKREIYIRYHREGAHWRYVFQSPAMMTPPLEPLSDWTSAREGKEFVTIDIDEGSRDWVKALSQHSWDTQKYLWLAGENLIFLFCSQSWPDSNRARFIGEANYQLRWFWAPLSFICLIWTIARALKQHRRDEASTDTGGVPGRQSQWLLPAIIFTWFAVQGLLPISVNEGRYRKPLTGLLIAQFVSLAGTRRSKTAITATASKDELIFVRPSPGDEPTPEQEKQP